MKQLRLAAVQTHPEFGALQTNLDAALALVPSGIDLAVLPELCASGYQFRSREEALALAEDLTADHPGPSCRRLIQFASDTETTIVAGLAEVSGTDLFNSALLVRPDGSRGLYRKVHLFGDEKLIFTPGDLGFPVFPACGTTIGLMICFDWIFPEAARTLALAGAEILCHPSNLLLPWCQDAMITRCRENMVAAVTANRVGSEARIEATGSEAPAGHAAELDFGTELVFSGRSQIVDAMGSVLDRLDDQETGAAAATVPLREKHKQFTPQNDLFADRRPEFYRN